MFFSVFYMFFRDFYMFWHESCLIGYNYRVCGKIYGFFSVFYMVWYETCIYDRLSGKIGYQDTIRTLNGHFWLLRHGNCRVLTDVRIIIFDLNTYAYLGQKHRLWHRFCMYIFFYMFFLKSICFLLDMHIERW